MTRIEDITGMIERGESVDWEQQADLLALDLVALGEEFKDDMLEQMRDADVRYSSIDVVAFYDNGSPKRVERVTDDGRLEIVTYYPNGFIEEIRKSERTTGVGT